MCAGADHCGRARDLLGQRVRAELQRAGMQAQQRDPVGQHVVHLARDARALGVADLLEAQLLLGLGMAHALAPRLAAPADEHAPRDDGGVGQRLDDEERQRRQRVVVGLHGTVDRKHRELQSGDEERQLPPAVGGDREQDDQAGKARRGREGHDRHRGQTEAEWPTPPPPQGEAERSATNHIEDKQGPVQPAADLVSQRQAA